MSDRQVLMTEKKPQEGAILWGFQVVLYLENSVTYREEEKDLEERNAKMKSQPKVLSTFVTIRHHAPWDTATYQSWKGAFEIILSRHTLYMY